MVKIFTWLKPHKWVVRWIVFILVLAQLFIAVSYILRPADSSDSVDFSQNFVEHSYINFKGFYEIEYDLDVVCIGASSVYWFWAPLVAWEEYGFTSYNLANNEAMTQVMLTLLKETLAYQTPELIVVDLRRFYMTSDARREEIVRLTTDSMKYSLNRTELLLELVPDILNDGEEDTLSYYLFDIAKYHDNWKILDQENFDSYANVSYSYTKGFYTYNLVSPELEAFADYSNHTAMTAPDDYTLSEFEEFLEYASTVEAEILFVVSPYAETEEAREIFNYYESLIVAQGMGYLNANDFTEEMDIVDTAQNFMDSEHVNIFGVEKYTSFLGEYITTNYDLPDRRTDEAYAAIWNQDYAIWTEDVLRLKEYIEEVLSA